MPEGVNGEGANCEGVSVKCECTSGSYSLAHGYAYVASTCSHVTHTWVGVSSMAQHSPISESSIINPSISGPQVFEVKSHWGSLKYR